MSRPFDENGPSPHAVALARAWLSALGFVWAAIAIGMLIATEGSDLLPVVVLAALALAHFALARYGSHRVAVFFAMWFP